MHSGYLIFNWAPWASDLPSRIPILGILFFLGRAACYNNMTYWGCSQTHPRYRHGSYRKGSFPPTEMSLSMGLTLRTLRMNRRHPWGSNTRDGRPISLLFSGPCQWFCFLCSILPLSLATEEALLPSLGTPPSALAPSLWSSLPACDHRATSYWYKLGQGKCKARSTGRPE